MAKADAALSFSGRPLPRFLPPGRQRALDACLFVITGGETRPRVDAGHPIKNRSALIRAIPASVSAPTATTECLNTLPPSRITSIRGWSTSATAMPGLWVTTVQLRSAGKSRSSPRWWCRHRQSPPVPAGSGRRRRATACLEAICTLCAFQWRNGGGYRQCPAMDPLQFSSAASSRRSRRMESSETLNRWLSSRTSPVFLGEDLEDLLFSLTGEHRFSFIE